MKNVYIITISIVTLLIMAWFVKSYLFQSYSKPEVVNTVNKVNVVPTKEVGNDLLGGKYQSDSKNCGAVGNECDKGFVCQKAKCVPNY